MSLLSLPDPDSDEPGNASLTELERLLAEDPGGSSYIWNHDIDADEVSPLLAAYRRQQQRSKSDLQIDWLRGSLPSNEVLEKALACLISAASDDAIQGQLLDICGYDHIEIVGQAIQKRDAIRLEAQERDQRLADALGGQTRSSAHHETLVNGHTHRQEQQIMQDRLTAALIQAKEGAVRDAQHHTYGHTPSAQLQFTSTSDKRRAKEERKAASKLRRLQVDTGASGSAGLFDNFDRLSVDDIGYSAEQMEQIRLEALEAAAARPLVDPDAVRIEEQPRYPHVYDVSKNSSAITLLGQRYSLPLGTSRIEAKEYWEVTIPTPKKLPMREGEQLIRIDELDPIAKGSFPGYSTLNRLQSLVYPVAYQSNENMLICAPTGAGKTDVAMLTVLRALAQYSDDISRRPIVPSTGFKIIYVAPMKALAAEIVRKMSKRLSWLGIVVRELTGDMQLTRQEIASTHFIVTTPEKWDVVTRKPEGDAELSGSVRLLIIDEVHLLHDERGAVIESIVARTLRQVESSQMMIRIVGLSATLPNYVDVADFLRVNRFTGLFYFDSSFRPVPLEQHFLGVKGKTGSPEMRNNLDIAAYDKVRELVKQGHQVMVFVHSRKDTVKTAEMLRTRFREEQELLDLIDPGGHPRYELFKRDLASSRNFEMKDLFETGFGIHHAGMLRSDRNLSEKLFEQDVTKVLVCTATLAWGVNLPAYAVVIKGTQIFDSAKGSFTDISILDVLQIFGRAGRPQYETHGVGYICTAFDKMDHYVSAITQQQPIESKFEVGLLDSLNAEIALGSVTTIDAGVRWIGYTYLYVRMRKNPLAYGMNREQLFDDPSLGSKRYQQMTSAVKLLIKARMISHEEDTGALTSTDLGRIASRYYLRYASIEVFNDKFKAGMSEAEALQVLSLSVEFDQLKVREAELDDLKMLEESSPFSIGGSAGTTAGKVNVLLQAYISRRNITDFALISDMGYVSQNAGRIARALLEIAITRRWSSTTAVMSSLCKAIEVRRWPTEHPLFQIRSLSSEVLFNASRYLADLSLAELAELSGTEIGELIHMNERAGSAVRQAARHLPRLATHITAQTLDHDLLQISISLERDFDWSDKMHGRLEPFWLWIAEQNDRVILQLTNLRIHAEPRHYRHTFVVSMPRWPSHLLLRVISERWFGNEEALEVDLETIRAPKVPPGPHRLLDIPLLRLADTQLDGLTAIFGDSFPSLTPAMTQCFHTLVHTRANALLALASFVDAQLAVELATWNALRVREVQGYAIVLCPSAPLVRRMLEDLRKRFRDLQWTISANLEDVLAAPDAAVWVANASRAADFAITADRLPSSIVASSLHLLDAAYEIDLIRLIRGYRGARLLGTTFPLIDCRDLARFLDVPTHHLYAFGTSARSEVCEVIMQSFSTHHSSALMRAMIPPTFEAINGNGTGATLCIVPTRGQARLTALELATLLGADMEDDGYGGSVYLEQAGERLRDASLSSALVHGIGVWHEAMPLADQRLVVQLVAVEALKVLVVPREVVNSIPLAAAAKISLTVVMGAQTVVSTSGSTYRQVQDYSLGEIIACANVSRFEGSQKVVIMCQKSQAELYERLLRTGLPLESSLMGRKEDEELLRDLVSTEIAGGKAKDNQDVVDLLSWTYLAHRLRSNPDYYPPGRQTCSAIADAVCMSLRSRGLLRIGAGDSMALQSTELSRRLLTSGARTRVFDALLQMGFSRVMEQGWGSGTKVEVDETALRAWQGRLPKNARNALDETTPAAAVLLAGWFAARTPENAQLEMAQADVLLEAVKRITTRTTS